MKLFSSDGRPWDARFFVIAGCFMLVNTAMLWIRLYSGYQLSILWPAIPAIIALALGVSALIKLYPRIANHAHVLAKVGVGFAILAAASLGIAAFWILVKSVFAEGMPPQRSPLFLLLIAIFMVAMVLAFLSNAIAFLKHSNKRKIGCLLALPVAMWALMLVVGFINNMEAGLSLVFYTNGIIGAAFIALGFTLQRSGGVK